MQINNCHGCHGCHELAKDFNSTACDLIGLIRTVTCVFQGLFTTQSVETWISVCVCLCVSRGGVGGGVDGA